MTTAENRQAFTRKVTDILQCYLDDGDPEGAVAALDAAAIFYIGHAPAWRRACEDGVTGYYLFDSAARRTVLLLAEGHVITYCEYEMLPTDADLAAADFVEHVCSTPRPMTITATGITKVCVRYRRDDE